jgi:hypothetical protein
MATDCFPDREKARGSGALGLQPAFVYNPLTERFYRTQDKEISP